MRIVAGKFRSRIIEAPEGLNTRPSSDKTRESIFNIINPYLFDAVILDIFSGSGALAIESISRGAKEATLIDNNSNSIECIKNNLNKLGIENQCFVLNDDYTIIKTLNKTFDVILLDPPYKMDVFKDILQIINENNLLSENGIIVFESDFQHSIKQEVEGYKLKVKKYGIAYVNILYKV